VTGEVQSAAEYAKAGLETNPPTLNTDAAYAYTGNCSYRYGLNNYDAIGIAFAAADEVRANFAFRHNSTALGNFTAIARVSGGSGAVLGLVTVSGTVYLRLRNAAGTTLIDTDAAGTGITATDTWHNIGMVFVKDTSLTVWVNGVQVLQHATAGDLNWQATGFYFGRSATSAQWANYAYFDDLYVDIGSGNVVAAPSLRRFLPAFPDGAGASAEWTPNTGNNYAAVAEAPPNDDTTYVKATGAGVRDLYTFTEIMVPEDYSVRAVIVAPYAKRTDAAVASTLKVVAVNGGEETLGGALTLPTTYGYVWQRLETKPDGDGWSEAGVNSSEFGVESSGVYS
jgi:hypothetical protein